MDIEITAEERTIVVAEFSMLILLRGSSVNAIVNKRTDIRSYVSGSACMRKHEFSFMQIRQPKVLS